MANVRRMLLDSNAVDPFVDLYGAFDAAEKAVASGTHEFLYTHVNVDELAETKDIGRRQHLLIILIALGRLVPTGAFALNYSRLNFSRLSDNPDVVEAVRAGNLDDTRDALLAATAAYEKCPLVTNDKRLRNRAMRQEIEVVSTNDLLRELGFRSSPR